MSCRLLIKLIYDKNACCTANPLFVRLVSFIKNKPPPSHIVLTWFDYSCTVVISPLWDASSMFVYHKPSSPVPGRAWSYTSANHHTLAQSRLCTRLTHDRVTLNHQLPPNTNILRGCVSSPNHKIRLPQLSCPSTTQMHSHPQLHQIIVVNAR